MSTSTNFVDKITTITAAWLNAINKTAHEALGNVNEEAPETAQQVRTNLELITEGTSDSRYTHRANNLSDVDSAPTSRDNLGLGTAATHDVGVDSGEVPTNAELLRQITIDGDSNHTLTSSEATANLIRLTGALTADRELVVPDVSRRYTVINDRTGGFDTTVKTAAGTGVVVPRGETSVVRSDGTNVVLVYAPGTEAEHTPTNADFGVTESDIVGTTIPGAIGRGAIVESGSNSNGYYARWENGEQICWTRAIFALDTGATTWTYPSDFIESSSLVIQLSDEGAGTGNTLSVSNVTTSSADLYASSQISQWNVLAWGYWK